MSVREEAKGLLQKLKEEYKEKQNIPSFLHVALECVFKSPYHSALDIIDHNGVTRLTSTTEYELIQVEGSQGNIYTIFPGLNMCSCPAFRYAVIGRNEYLMCKHVLAAEIALATGLHKESKVDDAQISDILAHL